MSAAKTAISDIKTELHKTGKVFIAYDPKITSIINEIKKDYIREQELVTSKREAL